MSRLLIYLLIFLSIPSLALSPSDKPMYNQVMDVLESNLKPKEKVERLNGMDVNAKDHTSTSPLHQVALSGNTEHAKRLLEVRFKFHTTKERVNRLSRDSFEQTPLHLAARGKSPEMVDLLVTTYPRNIHMKDWLGNTALHEAVRHGQYEIVEAFINNQAGRNEINNKEQSPLHYAALWEASPEIIDLLIRFKANPSAVDFEGNTPAHLASKRGYKEGLKALIASGADIFIPNKEGKLPSDMARNEEIRDFLKTEELLRGGCRSDLFKP